ncbi:hypothetical protein M405DRAFT_808664 [Rhizopogon salebrosus TDB-379]|nr:hypothetical protein M405DRAFT_808664 [Rhizopogon salebrosus TDB-379]
MSVRGDCADYNQTSVFDGSIIMRSPSDPQDGICTDFLHFLAPTHCIHASISP